MRSILSRSLSAAFCLAAFGGASAQDSAPEWYAQGAATAKQNLSPVRGRPAKNVILFIGDGMGISTVTAARILEGQQHGATGEENRLSFEQFPWTALSKTYSVDGQTPDSAPTMTAMMSGVKTNQGLIGVDQATVYNDCASGQGHEVVSLLELAESAGLATGIISSARITHATPAATYAHTANRNWESDANLTEEALANGCHDIARQLIEFPFGDGLEVALGGGRGMFLPETATDPEDAGRHGSRKDGRDLTAEWVADYPGSAFVWNRAQFDAINPTQTRHLLGLFERSHMEYELDRANDTGGEPSIAEMTAKAIQMLSQDRDGYFLMVEGGRIDHAHHEGNAARALNDAIALSDAVRVATDMTDENDTLIIVSADHSHVFTIAGYPDRGNPILGLVREGGELAHDQGGLPYTTLGYANGPGYRNQDVRPELTDEIVADADFLQEATVPMGSETHAAEDVGIYARGPGSQAFHGVLEQNVIYHVMAQSAAKIRAGVCGRNVVCRLLGGPSITSQPNYAQLRGAAR